MVAQPRAPVGDDRTRVAVGYCKIGPLRLSDAMVFELADERKDGRRPFALSDAVAVSFTKDAGGKVTSMTLHQAGAKFELPRDKPAKAEAVKKEEVAKYLGKYEREEDKVVVEVLCIDGALAIRVPGAPKDAELIPRADKISWDLRPQPGATITFQEDAGKVVSFTATLPDGKKLVRKRVEK